MADQPCAACGEMFEEDELLFSGRGRICPMCELDAVEANVRTRGVWVTIGGGPITAFAATMGLCFPFVGPFVSFALAIGSLWRAVVALQVFFQARDDDAFNGAEKSLLAVSGILTGLWSLGLLLVAGLAALVSAYALLFGGSL